MSDRLHKVLAHAGIASRRACERLIREGRVTVNGATVATLGVKVDPARDMIRVDGKRVPAPPAVHTTILLNKPRGVVTTLSDPERRPTVRDLIPKLRARVYPVGRLDFDSEGLLLLTDDGDLARRLMHPSSGVAKTYLAKVRGEPSAESLHKLAAGGLPVAGRPALPARARIVRRGDNCWVEITIVEGRNRQVRRMLEGIGHPVMRLRRTAYGGLTVRGLPPGRFRVLTAEEIRRLGRAIAPKPTPTR